jgi:pimeloyl-ACP methyl ester carboxylesterase
LTSENPEIGSLVQTGDLRTNHHDVGSGPPVLLLHGCGPGVSAWANWRLPIQQLADRFRLLAPDLAGFGDTEVPGDIDSTRERWLTLMGSLGVPFEITDGLDAVWGYEPSVEGLGRLMSETFAHDEDDIRAINHPTLLIHGRDDKVIPLSTTLTLLDWIDDGRAHLFGRCGHWTQSEPTDEFCAQVADFLSRGCAPTSR